MEWVDDHDWYLDYPELAAADIEWARRAVPPLTRDQWERIARTLGLVLAGDGSQAAGDGQTLPVGPLDDDAPEQGLDD
jgi:hypothetical protein